MKVDLKREDAIKVKLTGLLLAFSESDQPHCCGHYQVLNITLSLFWASAKKQKMLQQIRSYSS